MEGKNGRVDSKTSEVFKTSEVYYSGEFFPILMNGGKIFHNVKLMRL